MCWINWTLGSQNGRVQFIATNLTGILIAVIIVSSYRLDSFLKPIFALWTITGSITGILIYKNVLLTCPYPGKVFTAVLNYFIYGYIVIRTIIEIRSKGNKIQLNYPAFGICVLMLLWMFFSANEAVWPLWFCIIFGLLYISDLGEEKERILYYALVDGIIIGFFTIQGLALIFRPYDYARYLGLFKNENMNALFYSFSYGAFLCKWLMLKKNRGNQFFRFIISVVGCGIFGFCLLTGSKSGFFTMVFETAVFLMLVIKEETKKVISAFKYFSFVAAVSIVSVPVCYCLARYMPTVHLHPIYFEGEWSMDKIQPGEPPDSEKYVTYDTALEYGPRRIFAPIFSLTEKLQICESSANVGIVCSVAPYRNIKLQLDPGINNDQGNSELGRSTIYKFYLKKINFIGHRNDYIDEMISADNVAPHAHNFLLQMSFVFGAPAGIMMILMIISYLRGYFRMQKSHDVIMACIIGCFIGSFVVFGFFEIDWLCGQLPFTLFFLLYRTEVVPRNCSVL